jgi:hypothetical protein
MNVEKLKLDYEKVASQYVKALENMWEISEGYWVGNEVGGLYCFNDTGALNYGDLVFIVNNSVPFETYLEWEDYNTKANDFGFSYINLKSWIQGCPRVPEETFNRLYKMKQELMEEINNEKEKYNDQ